MLNIYLFSFSASEHSRASSWSTLCMMMDRSSSARGCCDRKSHSLKLLTFLSYIYDTNLMFGLQTVGGLKTSHVALGNVDWSFTFALHVQK